MKFSPLRSLFEPKAASKAGDSIGQPIQTLPELLNGLLSELKDTTIDWSQVVQKIQTIQKFEFSEEHPQVLREIAEYICYHLHDEIPPIILDFLLAIADNTQQIKTAPLIEIVADLKTLSKELQTPLLIKLVKLGVTVPPEQIEKFTQKLSVDDIPLLEALHETGHLDGKKYERYRSTLDKKVLVERLIIENNIPFIKKNTEKVDEHTYYIYEGDNIGNNTYVFYFRGQSIERFLIPNKIPKRDLKNFNPDSSSIKYGAASKEIVLKIHNFSAKLEDLQKNLPLKFFKSGCFESYLAAYRDALQKAWNQGTLNANFLTILSLAHAAFQNDGQFGSGNHIQLLDFILKLNPQLETVSLDEFKKYYKFFTKLALERSIQKYLENQEIRESEEAKRLLLEMIHPSGTVYRHETYWIFGDWGARWRTALSILKTIPFEEKDRPICKEAFGKLFLHLKENPPFELIKAFIALKIDLNVKIKGAYPIEKVYLEKNIPWDRKVKLIQLLLEAGAFVSSTQLDNFKRDLSKGVLDLAEPLHRNGHLSEEEYLAYTGDRSLDELNSPQSMAPYLAVQTAEIKTVSKRINISSDSLNFAKVAEWRLAKKKIKQYLATHREITAEFQVLESAFNDFCKVYDLLIAKQPLLSLLRHVSQDIRSILGEKTQQVTGRLSKMLSLWEYPSSERLNNSEIIIYLQSHPTVFDGIYRLVTPVAQRYFQDLYWMHCRSLWVHGTKSSTLLMMKKTHKQELLATGTLLKSGMPPLCGEVCGSHNDINEKSLSGMILTPNFDYSRGLYMNAGTRLLTSVLYANRFHHYHQHSMVFDIEETWKMVDPAYILQAKNEHNDQVLSLLRLNILRLRMVDPEAAKKLEPLREMLNQKQNSFESIYEEAIEAIDMPLPVTIDQQELQEILNPFPILFGCPDQKPKHKDRSDGEEFLNKEGLALGKEVQMVFAPRSHIQQLREELIANDEVKVEEFDMAFLLETMKMLQGSKINPHLIQYTDLRSAQIQIDHILKNDILPYYGTRLPKEPVYLGQDGIYHKVNAPYYGRHCNGYNDYLNQVENGELPRDIHGCMHAARSVFFAMAQMALFKAVKNPILVATAMGLHDSARQDEGKDVYERASAKNLREYLLSYGLKIEEIKFYVNTVKNKDPRNRQFDSDEQRIVHNSDCWEILRIIDLDHFEYSELNFETLSLEQEYIKDLTKEVKAFIDQTEDPELKKRLETESEHYYLDLLKIFAATHHETNSYPLLMELMKDAVSALEEMRVGY